MQKVAESDGFRRIFFGLAEYRRAVLGASYFGLVPAAIMGVDVPKFFDRAEQMVLRLYAVGPGGRKSGRPAWPHSRHGAKHGRNKLTPLRRRESTTWAPGSSNWFAGSTGKAGKGIIPVDRESLGTAAASMALTACLSMCDLMAPDPAQDRRSKRGTRRAASRARRRGRSLRPGRRIFPLGDGDRSGRLHPRHSSLRSTGRRGKQDGDAEIDR